MYQPTDYDLEILKLLQQSQPLTEKSIVAKLPEIQSVPLRLRQLSAYQPVTLVGTHTRPPIDECYIRPESGQFFGPSTFYVLTPLGAKTIQESIYTKRKEHRDLWLRNAWIPILVSLITNLVLAALRQLWPLILQWASSFLSTTP